MKAFLEEEVVELIELLDFVADLCVGQPEELNVALCRFTLSYYPAAELEATGGARRGRSAALCGGAVLTRGPLVSAREAPSDMAVIDETVTLCRRLRLKYVREQVSDVMLTAGGADAGILPRGTPRPTRGRVRGPGPLDHRDTTATGALPRRQDLRVLGQEGTTEAFPPPRCRPYSLNWVGRAENVVVAGPQGTGKSHLLEALGHHAVDQGLSVAWFSVEDLGAIIRRHRVDDTVSKAFAALASTSLCVIDDIGLLPIFDDAAEGLYRLVDAAYERRALALSTNLHPSGFDQLMDKTIASALVDRLHVHHTHVIVTDGESVRLADALAGKGVVPLS